MQSPADRQMSRQVQNYCSLRLTVPHSYQDDIIQSTILSDVDEYIIYKHVGVKTKKEHFHILIPGPNGKNDCQRYRDRAKTFIGEIGRTYAQNDVTVKPFNNGLESGCQYCSHEPVVPHVSSDSMQAVVDSAPPYVHRNQSMLPAELRKERDWQLTYSNLVPQAINHARHHSLTGGLKTVVEHMLDNTKWKPSYQMVKNGVPDFYINDYESRSGKRAKRDMSWFDFKG